ncbi:MAG: 5-(carboxyamino)imidazole ribonucleotide synthase [Gammaproteobacteria bacterium]
MKIGVLGGGQLGRMLALAGYNLGLSFCIYDPDPSCCSKELAPTIHAEFNDLEKLIQFANQVDIITYENENIPYQTLMSLIQYKKIYPGIEAVRICQDRLLEKDFLKKLAIPTTDYLEINSLDEVKKAAEILKFPFFLKSRRHGYDGKGQFKITDASDIAELSEETLKIGFIAEKFVAFDREFSIICAKGLTGEILFYDLCENVHRSGVLYTTSNKINDAMFNQAKRYVEKLVDEFSYIGIVAVEFFQIGEECLVNEIAPRVHNSGHWTIEGALTSQFENHLRAIIGLPLGLTTSRCEVLMTNILGEMPDKLEFLQSNQVFLHDYHKSPKPGRKLGHYTQLINAI